MLAINYYLFACAAYCALPSYYTKKDYKKINDVMIAIRNTDPNILISTLVHKIHEALPSFNLIVIKDFIDDRLIENIELENIPSRIAFPRIVEIYSGVGKIFNYKLFTILLLVDVYDCIFIKSSKYTTSGLNKTSDHSEETPSETNSAGKSTLYSFDEQHCIEIEGNLCQITTALEE